MPNKDPEAKRAAQRRWYLKHKKEQYQRTRLNKYRVRKIVQELKEGLSCVRCGENHPACLDFHHIDPTQKDTNIAQIWMRGWGKERILAEMAKCLVLCSNCHRKEHYQL